MDVASIYIPIDRRQALIKGQNLPERTQGTALFADVSGFTPLTEALARDLGPQRGAEELTHHLNEIYDRLISEVDRYGGSVIGFAGDAATCWFDGDEGQRATICGLAMQQAMIPVAAVPLPSGSIAPIAVKVAVAMGPVRRFIVGDPKIQVLDALTGETLDRLALTEHNARKGEVVLDEATVVNLKDQLEIREWRVDSESGARFAVASRLTSLVEPKPWPEIRPGALTEAQVRPWLLAAVYERLSSGQGEFLAELRPAVALFLHFDGIDYDADSQAPQKLDAFIRWVQEVLARYEGNLIQLTFGDKGDYLYAAIGAPIAHDDDAARAAAAAWELRTLPAALAFISSIQIGLSRGRMRTGPYGGPTRRTYGVLGDEANVAARLMQAAHSGQVLASERIADIAASAFSWSRLSALHVKGKNSPINVFALDGPKRQQNIHLQEPSYALPMVGREAELVQIEQKLALALQGQGQIVGITAEAGMGKSRLVAEVIKVAQARHLERYEGECQSYGTNSPYLVWQPIWQGIFDLDPAQPADEQAQRLEARIRQIDPALLSRLPLLGAVLNQSFPDNELTRSFEPKERKESLEDLLTDCLKGHCLKAHEAQLSLNGGKPLLLVLEDCHYLDPLSQDLLDALGRVIRTLPVLLLLAYRPPDPGRGQALHLHQLPYFTEIRLENFSAQEAERLIGLKLAQLSGVQAEEPALLVQVLTNRAQGNPFYLEELLNYLHNRGIDLQDIQAIEQLELPDSLHSLILGRIDQLSESQQTILKVASIIGRQFLVDWLWGVYPDLGRPEQVDADLQALNGLDLTLVDTPSPELRYLFKHIITQEAVYESLLSVMRARLHEQLGRFLEQQYAERLEAVINLLAYHYGRSTNLAKQQEYYRKAGEAAQATFANVTAIDYYQRLLPLLDVHKQAAVLLKLGEVQELMGQWSEAEKNYQQALQCAAQVDDPLGQAQAHWALGALLEKQGNYAAALDRLGQAQQRFAEFGDKPGMTKTLTTLGNVYFSQGDYGKMQRFYEESLALQRELDDKAGIANSLNNLGVLARVQGDIARAQALHEESVSLRRQIGDKRGIAKSLNSLGNVALEQGDYTRAQAMIEESLALLREIGDKRGIAGTLNNLGNIVLEQGDYSRAQVLYGESLTLKRELGDKQGLAIALNNLGLVASFQGDYSQAQNLYEESLALQREIGDKQGIGQSLNNLGLVVAFQGHYDLAQTLYEENLVLRRELGDKQGIAIALNNLGMVVFQQGDYDRAQPLYEESLVLQHEIGDELGIAATLVGLLGLAAARGQAQRAVRLAGATRSLLDAVHSTLDPIAQSVYEWGLAAARSQLDEYTFSTAWAEGQVTGLEKALATALNRPPDAPRIDVRGNYR